MAVAIVDALEPVEVEEQQRHGSGAGAGEAFELDIEAGAVDQLRQHVGARELLRVSIDYDRVEGAPALFNLVVQRLNRPGSELVADQELFESLSMDPSDERFVVDTASATSLPS